MAVPLAQEPGAGRKPDRRGTRLVRIFSLRDAVVEFVYDGDMVAAEGFTHLFPHAAGREIIRQGRRDLTLVRMTPDVIYRLWDLQLAPTIELTHLTHAPTALELSTLRAL